MGIDKDEFEQWAEGRSTSEVMDQFMGQRLLMPKGRGFWMEINKTDKPGFHFKVVRKQ